MIPRTPDFIGIGAQKAGTSWLRANLARHSKIWMPPLAELHYFDRTLEYPPFPPDDAGERLRDPAQLSASLHRFRNSMAKLDVAESSWWAIHEFLDRNDDWYRLLFSLAPRDCVVGEITPRYAICREQEIEQMSKLAPDTKLLFILRNPVDRFWSQCKMRRASGDLSSTDSAAMQFFESSNGRSRGEYTSTIARFCKYYDPSQMLIVFHDAIAREPHVVLEGVYRFLGLPNQVADGAVIAEPVNQAADRRAIPESLRVRIGAAYRNEMETLAEVFGGYASAWLEDGIPARADSLVQLTHSHLDAIADRPARVRASRLRHPIKVFCLSMQRSGTTSVGDWLEAHCLKRVGSPTAMRLGWTRLWFEGKYEEIFAMPEFQAAEILEDDPWWSSGFYRHLAVRFPEARFVLLTRDPDDWFDSLCHHSAGLNPAWTDVHARIYNRENDLLALLREQPEVNPVESGLLSVIDHREHYKKMYQQHTVSVIEAFANESERLFCGRLDDPSSFYQLCDFVGVRRNPKLSIPRSNARTAQMEQALSLRLNGKQI